MRRGLAWCVLGAALLGAGFTWGFAAHRQKIFPYSVLREVWSRLLPVQRHVESPSPALAVLQSLPYADAYYDPDPEQRGVLTYDRKRSWSGYNLYYSSRQSSAQLLDMEGREIHRWSYPPDPWQHAELLPDGGLLVIVEDRRLFRLDLRSRLVWSWEGRPHHDLSLHAGKIYVLTREARDDPGFHPDHPLLDDAVTLLTPEGEPLERISLLEILRDSPYSFLLPRIADLRIGDDARTGTTELDPLHFNHVEVFDGRAAHLSPLFTAGNLLLSARNVNSVLIVDGTSHEVRWLWGPSNLTFQHHPTLLESGHVLLFNNGSERSELIEVDPRTDRVVWRYRADGFFSALRGSNQRLPNGNTLVTQSDSGRVFEITPDGDVVWRFASPDVDEEGKRGVIWRMTRFAPAELTFLPERLR